MNKFINKLFFTNSTSPKNSKIATDRGLVKMIIVIVVALLILSYFGLNLRNIANAPTTQDNFGYVWGIVTDIWNNYLAKPATYVWNEIIIKYIWEPIMNNLKPKQMDLSEGRKLFEASQASAGQ
jgi:hypothetical protein